MVNYNEVSQSNSIEKVQEIAERLEDENLSPQERTRLMMEQTLRGMYITQAPWGY